MVNAERWELTKPFVISRGQKTHAETLCVTLFEDGFTGRGECVPYGRYGETVESVTAAIESARAAVEGGISRVDLQSLLPAGAARNAIDCALWDLACKRTGHSVWQLLGQTLPAAVPSVQTISIGKPDVMEAEAVSLSTFPVLKIKLDPEAIIPRVEAVHKGAPDSKLIIDANESWTLEVLNAVAPVLANLGVVMVEQPLKAGEDAALSGYKGPVPLGADESFHTSADVDQLKEFYDFVNIKLDKTGGLTEALAALSAARGAGLGVMVGSMVSTSLALVPALPLAAQADYVDLDSSNLLASDRAGGLALMDGVLSGIDSPLWGCP